MHIVGVQTVQQNDVSKYGIIDPLRQHNRTYAVRDLIEKPSPQEAPSNVAIMGRYILNPSIFEALQWIERGAGNEYQLTDALREVCRTEGLVALQLAGDRYDIGDKFGYMKAIMEIGLQREELRPQLLELMEILVSKERGKERSRMKTG